jgi:menaquinone-dependent protoporphyrinogen oxidase
VFVVILQKRMGEMKANETESKKMSRRSFLKTAAIGTAAAAVVCVGAGALASMPPAVEFYESDENGGTAMDKKVLVTYASKAGSTGEVAEAIGETLRKKGLAVDVKQVGHVADVSAYQAVVVGSCIRMGRWVPAAVDFVKANQAALQAVPTAFFQVGAGMREKTPEAETEAMGYSEPVRAIVNPVKMGLFAGKMDFAKLSFLDRTIAKMVGSVEGDWRDWDAIRAWANEI